MTRMIERWFPCAEVSDACSESWGSGNTESSLWVWFAKRPVAQAKAAVLTSLLPWPDDEAEQRDLQDLVRRALKGHTDGADEIQAILEQEYGRTPRVLDPFSGRAMIPLEAGRLQVEAFGVDYSPFAALGGSLLADLPFRDWSREPSLPFQKTDGALPLDGDTDRIVTDVETFLQEVGRRFRESMAEFYPKSAGAYPWGYLWASTLPCQECGRRFPLVGELELRRPRPKKGDSGQSFRIHADPSTGTCEALVHDGPPIGTPTRVQAGKSKYSADGRVAVCPFCDHVHSKAVHTRLSAEGMREDMLLAAADIDPEDKTKVFRQPTDRELSAAKQAAAALENEPPFGLMPARPDELIAPGNTRTIQSVNYGDRTYGDMCEARQTLGLVRLARAINEVTQECLKAGVSTDYARALAGYATAAMMRKIRRSTRGARLQKAGGAQVGDIFVNQSAVSFSYDWFESGLSSGPGSWESLSKQTVTALRNIRQRASALPASIQRGSATTLPFRPNWLDAVVTDPPYDDMIDYSDSSDVFFVWAKRAMSTADPMLSMTTHPGGVQDKAEEIIVKRGGGPAGDHRTREHYDSSIARAFAEARRVVTEDGVVTIVFGHGDLEVWHRLLSAISAAGLILTGSWPAKTEAGGASATAANIVTTLTMACRPAPPDRREGRLASVEAQVRAEVKSRVELWDRSGLAHTDMLMASAGPAMEVTGRYSQILDVTGDVVGLERFLIVARKAVQDAADIKVVSLPLDSFDARTRFALWWVRLYGRQMAPKSELRWQVLAGDLDMGDVKNLLHQGDKGCRLLTAKEFKGTITPNSSVIDVAFAMAKSWPDGLDAVAEVLVDAARDNDDEYLWSAIAYLANRLPEGEADVAAWNGLQRSRRGVDVAARNIASAQIHTSREAAEKSHPTLW
ncbi:DUF1156 domain-containing protein [Streptomyces europaeiscabiei]|uniref:DUF1156 domain-containing protein n=1 Tax=Streptomyces europaeiscabiei TaxID=146819 RepID=UPI0029B13620|nr:DUF1156 domain-containing protein [Streptomyces europaeiscabiei]MDX2758197.1 DUF1156 domain-containing protein [Streptomyces europaeiscabiei]